MGIEIERKFLLKDESWRREVTALPRRLTQGYFSRVPGGPTVRVRIADEKAFLTVKGRSRGESSLERSEFEYEIPVEDASAMLQEFCGSRVVKKLRYIVPAENGLCWEIDEYLEANQGLFTAEIELPGAASSFVTPPWLGEDVSRDSRYSNGSLSAKPYCQWKEEP
ncbi:MAG: CYTH domain-containing protein [Lentisphaeria bacterium]|nr:CYTH domain-containing protein [Lentisphaeria bacterium]